MENKYNSKGGIEIINTFFDNICKKCYNIKVGNIHNWKNAKIRRTKNDTKENSRNSEGNSSFKWT